MVTKQQVRGLNPKRLEIVRLNGVRRLVKHLKECQIMVSDRDFFNYFKAELFCPELYSNINLEPSLNEIVSGDIVILRDEELWPRDLRFFLEESEAWHVAMIYGRTKNMEFNNEEELKNYLKILSGKTYWDARRKGFECARDAKKLYDLHEHFKEFLPKYFEGAIVRYGDGRIRDNRQVLSEELGHCHQLYKSLK